MGDVCAAPQASAKNGLFAVKGYSHLTVFSNDPPKSNQFYKDVFGTGIRSYQGPTAPTLAVGPGVEFLMLTGGGGGRDGAAPRAASIDHFCMRMECDNLPFECQIECGGANGVRRASAVPAT